MARRVRRARRMDPSSTSSRRWLWLISGIVSGLLAGIPQVVLTQIEALVLPPASRSSADIGPRFIHRLADHLDADLDAEHHWLLAGAFHFGYAAWWGGVYALLQRWRPTRPHVGGPLLAALIYTLAFSPWGAATQTGTEEPVDARPGWSTLLHWTAALSFSLSLAYLYDRARSDPRLAQQELHANL